MELSRKTEKSKMVFREKGICSTTICPRGAIGFNTFPVEMRILVPKGSHGLYLEHTKMCMDGERELIQDMEAWKKSMAKEKRKLIKEDGKVDSTKIMP